MKDLTIKELKERISAVNQELRYGDYYELVSERAWLSEHLREKRQEETAARRAAKELKKS